MSLNPSSTLPSMKVGSIYISFWGTMLIQTRRYHRLMVEKRQGLVFAWQLLSHSLAHWMLETDLECIGALFANAMNSSITSNNFVNVDLWKSNALSFFEEKWCNTHKLKKENPTSTRTQIRKRVTPTDLKYWTNWSLTWKGYTPFSQNTDSKYR